MNKRQKLVQQQFLNDEETVIKRLKQVYGQSLKDINKKVFELDSSISMLQNALNSIKGDDIGELAAAVLKSKSYYTPEEAKETIKSMLQSKVYQKKYQKALQSQVDGILDKMQAKQYATVSEYLADCYENGFIGTMYDLQGQDIPLCFPMDQEQMVRAVQLDSKISQGLYSRLGEDVAVLKKKITAQISRGISTGMSYQQVAQQLAGTTNIGYNNAVRIARTEGHRIQCQAGMDACEKAKEKGADVVKQWDSTLDARTRESHAAVDGEIREIDKPFSNGLMFPGDPAGGAAEVINCRCALLQRARWALDDEEFTKMNNFTKQLETFKKPEEYDEFKKAFFSKENRQYMDHIGEMEEKYGTKDFANVLGSMTDREYKHYSKLLANNPIYNKKQIPKKALTNSSNSGKISLGNCHDFDELGMNLSRCYGIDIDDDVKQLDFATVRDAMEGVQSMLDEFPELAKNIKRISVDQSGVMACTGKEITFNPAQFGADKKILESCKKYSGSHWWVNNCSPACIGVHECAHSLEDIIIHANQLYQFDFQRVMAWNDCTEAKKIVSQACKNIKKTPYGKGKKNAELISSISRYASDTASETMAEAFADIYANGKNANPLSIEIKRLTLETLTKYKKGGTP